jgi:hypothetical protein
VDLQDDVAACSRVSSHTEADPLRESVLIPWRHLAGRYGDPRAQRRSSNPVRRGFTRWYRARVAPRILMTPHGNRSVRPREHRSRAHSTRGPPDAKPSRTIELSQQLGVYEA